MINSEWLESFVAFAEAMNFTRAAERRHISQPALHVQIQKLSALLGVPLYVRRGRTLELTAQGREVLAFGREQRSRNAQLEAALRPGAEEPAVTLAAGEGTYLHLLPPALRSFQRSRDCKLRVLTRNREQALSAVLLGEADLAVTVADEVPQSVLARPLLRVGASVVLPAGHALARKRTLSIPSLERERLIVPPLGRPLRNALAHAFSEARVAFVPTIEVSGWELMLCFAELGLGLAVVNDFCKAPRGTVKRRLRGLPSVEYQLLRLRERKPSEAARALEHAITSEVRKR